MIANLLASLQQSGLLPWAVSMFVFAVGALVISRSSRASAPSNSRLRRLTSLQDATPLNARFHAGTGKRVVEDDDDQRKTLSDHILGRLGGIAGTLPLLGAKDREKMRSLLAKAGVMRDNALGLVVMSKLGCAVIGVGAAWFTINFMHMFENSAMIRVLICMCGAVLGSMSPEFALNNMASARRTEIVKSLPDALDLLVICTEAGLSLDPAIERVAREMRLSAKDLARELGIMSHEMRLLPRREMAFENFIKRNDYREVRSLMGTLIQTLRYGTSLAQSLRVLAIESRNGRMLAVEEKAARLPAMLSIPVVLFMLPAIFLVVGGPAISQVLRDLHH